ncbi:hypothetical protein, partial [Enterococcus faecium]
MNGSVATLDGSESGGGSAAALLAATPVGGSSTRLRRHSTYAVALDPAAALSAAGVESEASAMKPVAT